MLNKTNKYRSAVLAAEVFRLSDDTIKKTKKNATQQIVSKFRIYRLNIQLKHVNNNYLDVCLHTFIRIRNVDCIDTQTRYLGKTQVLRLVEARCKKKSIYTV